jgi:hypothetical protein
MRYDKAIFFQKLIPGEYNKDTGNYEDDRVEEFLIHASVMDTGIETKKLLYGDIKQDSKTIHLQTIYKKPFDFIRIGGKRYKVDHERRLRQKQVLTVSEVQGR